MRLRRLSVPIKHLLKFVAAGGLVFGVTLVFNGIYPTLGLSALWEGALFLLATLSPLLLLPLIPRRIGFPRRHRRRSHARLLYHPYYRNLG